MLGSWAGVARAVWFRVVFEHAVHTWSQRLSPLFSGRGQGARESSSLSSMVLSCSSPHGSRGFSCLARPRASRREHSNFTVKVLLKIGRTLLYFRAGLNEDAGKHPLYVYMYYTVPTAHVMYRSLHEPQAHAQSRRRLPFHSAPPSPGASRARRLVGASRRSRCAASPAAR